MSETNPKELNSKVVILMADDDDDDRLLAADAFKEARLLNPLNFVHDGEELMDYLYCRGKFADSDNAPRPGLILLDLNMPKKDGREALREIKSDETLRQIPIIILTTSKDEKDVFLGYDLGASSVIVKPVTFEALVEVIKIMGLYWFEIVKLPQQQ